MSLQATITNQSLAWEVREEGETFRVMMHVPIRCRRNGECSVQVAEDIEAKVGVKRDRVEWVDLDDARKALESTCQDLRGDGFEVLESIDELMVKADSMAAAYVRGEIVG